MVDREKLTYQALRTAKEEEKGSREEDGKTDLGIGWRTNYVQLSNPARKASRISAPHVRRNSVRIPVGCTYDLDLRKLLIWILLKNLCKDSTLFNRISTCGWTSVS